MEHTVSVADLLIAVVVAVLVWLALLAFLAWLLRAPLAGLLDAVTSRVRRSPES